MTRKRVKESVRNRLNLSVTIDKKILKDFKEHCKGNCMNVSRKTEAIVKKYLEENGRK